MSISLNDLCREQVRLQPQSPADLLFHPRVKMSMGPNGSAQFSHGNRLSSLTQSHLGTVEFVIHQGHLQPKSDRLGMDPVAPPNHGRILVFQRLPRSGLPQRFDVREQNITRFYELNRQDRKSV